MKRSSGRIALGGLLLSLMLALGYVESLLPAPSALPGVKLGLSNGVLVFAAYMLPLPAAYGLMAGKVLLSALLFAGPGSILYAGAGGLLSLSAMCLLRRVKGLHPVAVSMAGGFCHNLGQSLMALWVLRTPALMGYFGLLLLCGLAAGAVTGLCAHGVMNHLNAEVHHIGNKKE